MRYRIRVSPTKVAAILTAIVFPCAGDLIAQISTATLTGTVTDSTGGALAGATVEAKNNSTLLVRTATANNAGEYVIPDLSPAHYTLTIHSAGFKSFIVPDLELLVAQRAQINAKLEVGQVDQSLTITAVTPIIDTSTASVGQVINTQSVDHMPLNGRSFWQLTSLTPGATYNPGGQTTHTGGTTIRASVVAVNVNGGAQDETGWSLDGAFITEMQSGGTMIQPDVDALQEFKVEGANMTAEYGHTPNMVNVTMKSGSNQFHGTLFEFVRNSAFDARNFFYIPPIGSSLKNEPLRRNQYGFTFGGPLYRNKTFFFADWERTGLLQGVDFNNVVPSPAQRTGDFSQLLQGSKPLQLKDPLSGAPYPGNIIPPSLISTPAKYFLPYLPVPNSVVGTTDYSALTNDLLQTLMRGDIRMDQVITGKTQLMGRYSINNSEESDPNPFVTLGQFPLYSRGQSATVGLTHLFSPRWVNEARVSYYRSYFLFGTALGGTNFNAAAGVQGFNDTTPIYSFPEITLTGYATFNGSPFDQRPKSNKHRNWQYADNVTYSNGRHTVKFGAELLHEAAAYINGSSSVGIFNFVGTYTGNAFADFLTGYPDSVTRDYFKQLNGYTGNFFSAYVQDSFRFTPNITINAGLRFEYNGFYNGIRGQKSAFDLTTGKLIIPSSIDPAVQSLTASLMALFADRINYTKSLGLPVGIQPGQPDFAPRFGIAWRPRGSDRMVIRTGYGIFYLFPDGGNINNFVATVPFIAATTIFNDRPPATPTRTWSDFFLGQPNVSPNPNPGQPCSFGYAALSCATPNVDSGAINLQTTYIQEWNFSVQRQISSTTSIDVAYVGSKSDHLQTQPSINDPPPGPGAIQSRRPYPEWGTIVYGTFDGWGSYNALQAKFESRNWHGLTSLASYSYSKCIDIGTGVTQAYQVRNKAVCDYNLPHVLATSFDYQVPIGRGQRFLGNASGFVNQIVGGWEFAGILTARSGLPFTPTINGDVANTGVSNQRPQVVGTPQIVGSPACWFYISSNPSCVALDPGATNAFVAPATYTYGDGGRNILRADPLIQLDFTTMKHFQVDEKRSFEFRAEMFNILNHPVFAAPSTAINSSSGAQVSSTLNAARIIQLALKFRF
jgi:Carboxypeptidase regulatory-like domain